MLYRVHNEALIIKHTHKYVIANNKYILLQITSTEVDKGGEVNSIKISRLIRRYVDLEKQKQEKGVKKMDALLNKSTSSKKVICKTPSKYVCTLLTTFVL